MPNLLDIDPSVMEKNLLFKDFEDSSDFSPDSLFNIKPKEPDEIPWKPVKPNPGYCVKLRTQEGDKVFVNVCHTDMIPEPAEISEEKLLQMIMDDDIPSFMIPISIGDLHIESDKSRNPCSVYDIAVNTKFFQKMDSSEVFNTFFLNVSIQGLQEKYSLNLDLKSEKPYLLLKNRKVIGTLQIHRIQQRNAKKAPGELIQEIDTPAKTSLIQVISEENNTNKLDHNHSNSNSVKSPLNEKIQKTSCNELETPETPSPEEKGIQESSITKANLIEELPETQNVEGPLERLAEGDALVSSSDNNQSSGCRGLFCLQQFPENGYPEMLIASVRLNVKSSKDFNLELDDNRLNISLFNDKKPWFDVYLPYKICVNSVQARFVTKSQRLLVKMDVLKS